MNLTPQEVEEEILKAKGRIFIPLSWNCMNFGCGKDLKKGYDNVDLRDFDFNIFPYPIKNNTYDYVYCHQVLEHLKYPERTLYELHRICKPNAIIDISVPHMNNDGSFSMFGHISYFTEDSFRCLTDLKDEWRYWAYPGQKWEIVYSDVTPSPHFGRFIPKFMRKKLSMIIRGIYKDIIVKLRVIKS